MIDLNRSRLPHQYEVTVGFSRVTVTGVTPEDVIQEARRALCATAPAIRRDLPPRNQSLPSRAPARQGVTCGPGDETSDRGHGLHVARQLPERARKGKK